MLLELLLSFLLQHLSFGDDALKLNSLPIEEGLLCSNGVLSASHFVGLPPSQENYFNGSFHFDRWPFLRDFRIELRLRAPATLTLNPEYGRVDRRENNFFITLFEQDDGKFKADFKVQGRPNEDFPAIDEVRLNAADICPDKTDWKPTILGSKSDESINVDAQEDDSNFANSTCGVRKLKHQGLITNGYPSKEGDWPWHAAIFHVDRQTSSYKCGGSLISSNAILSAGHCITENFQILLPERILVKLGQHNRLVGSRNTQEHQVLKVIPHQDFYYVQPVCLWDPAKIELSEVIGKTGIVVGWGFNEDDVLSDILSQASMPVVSLTTCLRSNRPFYGFYLTDMNYCAGFRNGTSVCNGDSGGGMFFKTEGAFKLRGIVSITIPRENSNLCSTDNYVIFTDVARYLDWINAEVND